jgi:2-keto-4-pentenoate hydratase
MPEELKFQMDAMRMIAVADWLEGGLAAPQPCPDILEQAPDLALNEAYRIQQTLIERRVATGDRVMGYKAAFTSKAMQRQFGVAEPVIGTLLESRRFGDAARVPAAGFRKAILEPEVAVVLRADLYGPQLVRRDAMAAIAGYLPCVEVADLHVAGKAFSPQHAVACNTFNGANIFGSRLTPPEGIDLRTEGVVLAVNGEVRASATAIEVLGDPINAVVFMANKLGELGWPLRAGMVLMTGGIVASVTVQPGDEIQVDYARLGRLRLQITD